MTRPSHKIPLSVDSFATSRRDFLTASAAGLLGLATGARRLAWGSGADPEDTLLYVGTYTEGDHSAGIYLVRMDLSTGALRQVGSVDAGANPSFLALHPSGGFLYAVNETEEYDGRKAGAVSAFAVAPDTDGGGLTRLNQQSSEGGAPCYVSVDQSGQAVLVANYVGGNVALLPIQTDGALGRAKQVVQHVGNGPDKERQEAAHSHCIIPDPSNRFVLVADLGIDRVLVYRADFDAGTLHHIEGGDAVMRPGAGPRHLAFHPTLPLVYVANELNSTVTSLRLDAERGALTVLETRSTLPLGWTGRNYPADIHVAPSGGGRTLYVSNRGHNSLAVFSVASAGRHALVQTVSTGGDWPRNFTLDPTGRWVLVANQRSGSVVVFARDEESGRLAPTPQRIAIPNPVCLRFRTQGR